MEAAGTLARGWVGNWVEVGSPRRRLLLAACVYLGCTVVFFCCAPRQLLTEHTRFNHYALLADAWLNKRLDLGHAPPAYTQNNDFAEHAGRWYVTFPPFPALILLPFVKIAGSPENLRDGQIWLWIAGLGPSVLFLALEKLRRLNLSECSERANLALSWIFAFGTVYFFTAEQGSVWYAAHVVAVVLGAFFLLFAVDAERPLLAGISAGLLFATRPHAMLVGAFFLFELFRKHRNGDLRSSNLRAALSSLSLFALPIAIVVAVTVWHNHARFGTLQFGYDLLAIGWHARIQKWGLFSYHYLARNLGIVTSSLPYINKTDPRFQINSHGLALWVTTPIYLWLIWPRRASFTWKALAISIAPVVLMDLLYQNSGWLQFGYRFSNDYSVFLFALLAMGGYRFGRLFYAAAGAGIVVNTFGALTFQRENGEKFYYTDNSQTIIYQPD